MWDKFRIALFHTISWMARIIALVLATVMPWWYGGAQWHAQWWLVVGGIALAVLTWLATILSPRRTSACVPLSIVMIAFLLWVMLQLVPFPQFLASHLSGAQRFVGEVVASSQVSSEQAWLQPANYRTLSIAPIQTKASLAVLAVAAVLIWSASTLLLHKRWAIVVAVTLMVGGATNAAVGLLQLTSWSQWTLLDMPRAGTYFSTFVSRNSAPAYFASITGASLLVMSVVFNLQKRARRKNYKVTYPGSSLLGRVRNRLEDVFIDLNSSAITCLLVLAFMLLVTLATFSRGGILACLASCAITICLTLGSRGAGFVSALALAGTMLAVVVGVLSFLELDRSVYSRLDAINTSLRAGDDPRWIVWGYTFKALATYGLAGCGLGSFRFALQPFHSHGPNVWFHHAENVPLEVFLETGLPGILLAGLAVYVVLRQLLVHCHRQKENLLLPAVIFSTSALGIQSIVDFSIFLPGVFVPYCLLLGAFLGRSRRIDQELHRLDELGVQEFDQRTQSKLPARSPSRGKLLGHSAVAVICLLSMVMGLPSLAGYAVAESLQQQLSGLETRPLNNEEKQRQYEGYVTKREDLQAAINAALSSHSDHPEVSLLIGQIEQVFWRLDATEAINWGDGISLTQKWDLANPQVLSMLLRLDDPTLKPIQDRIRAHAYGLQLSEDSLNRMSWALAACPQDARAAWGILVADCNWLSRADHQALLDLLGRVIGNNTQVMVEVAIIAIREGNGDQGLAIFKRALEIEWPRMNRSNLGAIVRHVDADELLSMLPEDAVKQAQVVELLDICAKDPAEPLPHAAELAEHLSKRAYELLPSAQATDADRCRVLAAIAKRNHDLAAQVKLLRVHKLYAPNDLVSRLQLVDSLQVLGQDEAALKEVAEALRNPTEPDKFLSAMPPDPTRQFYLYELLIKGNLPQAAPIEPKLKDHLCRLLPIVRGKDAKQSRIWADFADQCGDDRQKMRHLRDLAVFSPNDFPARLELAKLCQSLGRPEEATKELKSILEQDPPESVASECRNRLKNLPNP